MSNNLGQLIIISAPSGAGKTSVIRSVIDKLNHENNKSIFSISHTTRIPREGDINGRDYYFVSEEKFEELSALGTFIETAEVHDNKYGTSKDFISDNLKLGINVFLEIDVQGFQHLKSKNIQFRSIFILPPSIDELKVRITTRGLDTEEVIKKRMKNALKELNTADQYDYLVINDVLVDAVNELHAIVIDDCFKDKMYDRKVKILQDLLSK